jgi:hypothetical protein
LAEGDVGRQNGHEGENGVLSSRKQHLVEGVSGEEPKSTKGVRVELPHTSPFDYAQKKLSKAQCSVARAEGNLVTAEEAVDRAYRAHRDEKLKAACLRRVTEKKRNLTADEYESLLKDVEAHTASYIKSVTTTDPFDLEEVEQRLWELWDKIYILKEKEYCANQNFLGAEGELYCAKEKLEEQIARLS